nr:MAG TPA: BRICHOS domain protein [Bacteriophage sp.]
MQIMLEVVFTPLFLYRTGIIYLRFVKSKVCYVMSKK